MGRAHEDNWRTGLAKIAELLKGGGGFRMTCNQQVLVTDVPEGKKAAVQKLLNEYSIAHTPETTVSGMRRNMVACVALPTCPLAFAEAALASDWMSSVAGVCRAVVKTKVRRLVPTPVLTTPSRALESVSRLDPIQRLWPLRREQPPSTAPCAPIRRNFCQETLVKATLGIPACCVLRRSWCC